MVTALRECHIQENERKLVNARLNGLCFWCWKREKNQDILCCEIFVGVRVWRNSINKEERERRKGGKERIMRERERQEENVEMKKRKRKKKRKKN